MTTDGGRPDGGFALVAVLGFMLLAAAIVAPFAVTARTTLLVDSRESERQKASLLGDGLAFVLAARVQQGAFGERLARQGALSCADAEFAYAVRLQDQAGLVDLNAATPELIAAGLSAVGVTGPAAKSAAAAIERFRGGPADANLKLEDPEDGWKSAPFESVAELHDFALLRGVPLEALYDTFTVHSKRGIVRLDEAPPRLARAIAEAGADPGGTAGLDARSVGIMLRISTRDGAVAVASGYIVRLPDKPAGEVQRLEPLPSGYARISGQLARQASCADIFGQAAWNALKGWGA